MKTLIQLLARGVLGCQRFAATYKVRSIEIRLDGQNEALQYVVDSKTIGNIMRAREETKAELAEARADLMAFYPPGTRFTWGNG
jgi:surface antigen